MVQASRRDSVDSFSNKRHKEKPLSFKTMNHWEDQGLVLGPETPIPSDVVQGKRLQC